MYFIPLVVLIVIAVVAVAWTPVFAVALAALAILGFFTYVGLRRRSDETEAASPNAAPTRPTGEDISHGVWGEK